jgi:transcriptional regulator with XRE-family HTH domain
MSLTHSISAEKVKQARHDLGLSLRQASKKCEINIAQYCNYENGKTLRPQKHVLRRLAKGLEVKPIELMRKESADWYYNTPHGQNVLKSSWINKYYHKDEPKQPTKGTVMNGAAVAVTTVKPLPEFKSTRDQSDQAAKLRAELDRMKELYHKSQQQVVELQHFREKAEKLAREVETLRSYNQHYSQKEQSYEMRLSRAKAEAAHYKDQFEKINQPKYSDLDLINLFREWSGFKND